MGEYDHYHRPSKTQYKNNYANQIYRGVKRSLFKLATCRHHKPYKQPNNITF